MNSIYIVLLANLTNQVVNLMALSKTTDWDLKLYNIGYRRLKYANMARICGERPPGIL